MKFPYVRFGPFYRPVIPVTFLHKDLRFPYQALVDTGADVSVVHGEIAAQLDLDLKSGKPFHFAGISSRGIGYIHHINLDIGGTILKHVPIVFSSDISPRGYGVLGHEELFDKTRLIFEYAKRQLEIVPKNYRK